KFDNVKMNCVSGVLAILVTLIFFNLVFTILATVPMTTVQNILSGSFLVRVIVNDLPPLSNIIKALWVTAILG
ncbi:MAG: CvpA family protein, partial [Streptococcus gallolyticus]|nr:CvpA family protein [Streptococcus gallolyticus]